MAYILSVWMDKESENNLRYLAMKEDRSLSAMVKVLVKRAVQKLDENALNKIKEGEFID